MLMLNSLFAGLANWTHMVMIDEPRLFNCSSSTSSNTCDHSWIKENGELVSSGPLIQVDSAGKYFCEARCSVRGLPCMVFPMAVEFRGTEGEFLARNLSDSITGMN